MEQRSKRSPSLGEREGMSRNVRGLYETISRKLKELSERELIDCKTSSKGIEVVLTAKGRSVLNSAYFALKKLLEKRDEKNIVFSGKVVSGLGEGKYYLSFEKYSSQINEKLGFVPFAGTLNLEGNFSEVFSLLEGNWIEINGFETKDRSFGKILCYPIKINKKIDGAIVFPERGVKNEKVIELVAPFNLRKKLNLKNGSIVLISIR